MKRYKKTLLILLAFCMIVGGVHVTPLTVSAAERTFTKDDSGNYNQFIYMLKSGNSAETDTYTKLSARDLHRVFLSEVVNGVGLTTVTDLSTFLEYLGKDYANALSSFESPYDIYVYIFNGLEFDGDNNKIIITDTYQNTLNGSKSRYALKNYVSHSDTPDALYTHEVGSHENEGKWKGDLSNEMCTILYLNRNRSNIASALKTSFDAYKKNTLQTTSVEVSSEYANAVTEYAQFIDQTGAAFYSFLPNYFNWYEDNVKELLEGVQNPEVPYISEGKYYVLNETGRYNDEKYIPQVLEWIDWIMERDFTEVKTPDVEERDKVLEDLRALYTEVYNSINTASDPTTELETRAANVPNTTQEYAVRVYHTVGRYSTEELYNALEDESDTDSYTVTANMWMTILTALRDVSTDDIRENLIDELRGYVDIIWNTQGLQGLSTEAIEEYDAAYNFSSAYPSDTWNPPKVRNAIGPMMVSDFGLTFQNIDGDEYDTMDLTVLAGYVDFARKMSELTATSDLVNEYLKVAEQVWQSLEATCPGDTCPLGDKCDGFSLKYGKLFHIYGENGSYSNPEAGSVADKLKNDTTVSLTDPYGTDQGAVNAIRISFKPYAEEKSIDIGDIYSWSGNNLTVSEMTSDEAEWFISILQAISPTDLTSTSNTLTESDVTIRIRDTEYPFSGIYAFSMIDAPQVNIGSDSAAVYFDPAVDDSIEKFISDSDIAKGDYGASGEASILNFYERFAIATAGKYYCGEDTSSSWSAPDNMQLDACIHGTLYQQYAKSTYDGYTVDAAGESFTIAIPDGDIISKMQSELGYTVLDVEQAFGLAYLNTLSAATKDNFTDDWLECYDKDELKDDPHAYSHSFPNDLIYEYAFYATKIREKLGEEFDAPIPNEDDNKDEIAMLQVLFGIQEQYGSYYPILQDLWVYETDTHEESLQDLLQEEYYSGLYPNIYDDDAFERVVDYTSILGLFYTMNFENGIQGIDKEAIWNDMDTDLEGEALVQEYQDWEQGVEDEVNKEYYTDQFDEEVIGYNDYKETTLWDVIPPGINADRVAVSAKAVTMSDFITTGMKYSATYVPMKTNIYSPDTISQYEQEFRDEFFYKYGFMRKALLWDKSGSSVMDFYNAGAKVTNTLEVVTLRDLIESNGNDISLYVDDDFYNADEVMTEANDLLELRRLNNEGLAAYLMDYYHTAEFLASWSTQIDSESTASEIFGAADLSLGILNQLKNWILADENEVSTEELHEAARESTALAAEIESKYNYSLSQVSIDEAYEYALDLSEAVSNSNSLVVDYALLKHEDYSQYSSKIASYLLRCEEIEYRVITETDFVNNDNLDTIVLPSSMITSYIDAKSDYRIEMENEDNTVRINTYTSYDNYTPMLSLSFVSLLYRSADALTLANLTANNNPVFLASDDLCGLTYDSGSTAEQWYANTLLNYALIQNLPGATQIDYTYCIDLDCPLYIDVFGNIITESGIVVIPAACNMTLHNASYKDSYVPIGLYSIYGMSYYVGGDVEGAPRAMMPFFIYDPDSDVYVVNGQELNFGGGKKVTYNKLETYNVKTQEAIMHAYESYVKSDIYTNLNWVACVNIVNEVMRGAPIENIDKEAEGLNVSIAHNQAGFVAAAKLEELIKSFEGAMATNTLFSIPDFSRMDDMEYLIGFLIKVLMVATAAVVIIGIYRDGVSGELGLRTFWKSLSSIALTFAAVCIIPAIFQLTYYAANKFLLQDEALRILMLNEEKYHSGIEIGVLETTVPESTTDMAIQLDWISVPWYEQLDNMLYGSSLQNLDETKREAYLQSPIYDNYDVTLYNDGVYTTIDELFGSISIDYSFNNISASQGDPDDPSTGQNYLYMYADNSLQTASFYSPYYVFLYTLTGNINEYNFYHDTYNHTTKYMSGNRLKTVGLCHTYFTSTGFMEMDTDILHLYEIYELPIGDTYDHGLLFSPAQVEQFKASAWYMRNIDVEDIYDRIDIMNRYARDFVADNKDMLTKVTDETFIKVMSLAMAVKYNQLFGIPYANAIEIYNMDSNDLLRLSIAPADIAVLSSPLSYSRYVYDVGGEPAVYAAAILTVIMWVGSFIKPLCTVIVFVSVFLSIWVFRVVLRKPSANLWGYLITCLLLCGTNFLHAVLLKISCYLPNGGLSMLGCLIFLIFGQVCYLLVLAYVTGVSLKDWSNLGYTEYAREARWVRKKLKRENTSDMLSGKIKHHENNWDYYNDLVEQHRSRNA